MFRAHERGRRWPVGSLARGQIGIDEGTVHVGLLQGCKPQYYFPHCERPRPFMVGLAPVVILWPAASSGPPIQLVMVIEEGADASTVERG